MFVKLNEFAHLSCKSPYLLSVQNSIWYLVDTEYILVERMSCFVLTNIKEYLCLSLFVFSSPFFYIRTSVSQLIITGIFQIHKLQSWKRKYFSSFIYIMMPIVSPVHYLKLFSKDYSIKFEKIKILTINYK